MNNKNIWMAASDSVVLPEYKKMRVKFLGSELFIEQKVYLFSFWGSMSWGID